MGKVIFGEMLYVCKISYEEIVKQLNWFEEGDKYKESDIVAVIPQKDYSFTVFLKDGEKKLVNNGSDEGFFDYGCGTGQVKWKLFKTEKAANTYQDNLEQKAQQKIDEQKPL